MKNSAAIVTAWSSNRITASNSFRSTVATVRALTARVTAIISSNPCLPFTNSTGIHSAAQAALLFAAALLRLLLPPPSRLLLLLRRLIEPRIEKRMKTTRGDRGLRKKSVDTMWIYFVLFYSFLPSFLPLIVNYLVKIKVSACTMSEKWWYDRALLRRIQSNWIESNPTSAEPPHYTVWGNKKNKGQNYYYLTTITITRRRRRRRRRRNRQIVESVFLLCLSLSCRCCEGFIFLFIFRMPPFESENWKKN